LRKFRIELWIADFPKVWQSATFKYTFRKKNPTGTYQVLGKTNVTGTAISTTTSFVVN